MKRTKNMTFKRTPESRELLLYAKNDALLYGQVITPVISNLQRKAQRGQYDKEKAVDAFYHVSCCASEKYKKDFGYAFSVQDRFTTAVLLEESYREEIL